MALGVTGSVNGSCLFCWWRFRVFFFLNVYFMVPVMLLVVTSFADGQWGARRELLRARRGLEPQRRLAA